MTGKQQAFIDALFGEAKGNFGEAKRMAGYSDNTKVADILNDLAPEISKQVHKIFVQQGVKAAFAIESIIDDPTALGNKDKLAAAKDILDRAGFKATDKVEVKGDSVPVWVLPKKEEDNDDDVDTGANS